jgi:geranylgeranyl reductase family protein
MKVDNGNNTMYDVIVAGAGPAGASAAHFLSKAGKKVLVLEKERLPRYKACGGGLSPKILEQFDFSFEPVIEQRVSKVTFALRDRSVTAPVPRNTLVMVMRDRFDQHILANSDVRLREQARVKTVKQTTVQVTIETRDGERFLSRYLIGSDGANSVVARELGLRRTKKMAAAIEAEVPLKPRDKARFQGHAFFIFGELKQSYLWIFPKENALSVGAAALHPSRGVLQSTLAKVMSTYGVPMDEAEVHGHPIPITLRDEHIATPRCFLVGDAAGLADPFSGEGIRLAITSGRLAAQAILAGRPEQYTFHVDKMIRASHRWGRLLAKLFYAFPELCFYAGVSDPRAILPFLDVLAGEADYKRVILRILAGLPDHLTSSLLGRRTSISVLGEGDWI